MIVVFCPRVYDGTMSRACARRLSRWAAKQTAWILAIPCGGCFDRCLSPPSSGAEIIDLETRRAELLTLTPDDLFGIDSVELVEGECGPDGPVFLFHFSGPFTWEYDFFDRESGAFVARSIGQDDTPPYLPCFGGSFWPWRIACEAATVTDVLAGDRYHVGDGPDVLASR